MTTKEQDNDSEKKSSSMYGKLFNRLKKGCQTVKDSARSFRTRSRSASSVATTSKALPEAEEVQESASGPPSQEKLRVENLAPEKSISDEICLEREEKKSLEKQSSNGREIPNVTSSKSYTDQFWIGLINSHLYKNWLKVGLALRSVCDFIAPVLEEIVHNMHSQLLDVHGYGQLTLEHVNQYRKNSPESGMLRGWVKDIMKLHRQPPTPNEIFRISDVAKWPTYDGAWEIARVFMSRGYRSGGSGVGAAAFDISALLNFMYKCRMVDDYVYDFNNVKRVLQVRNITMHSPRLEVDDEMLDESFDTIFDLLKDAYLSKRAEKYIETKLFFEDVAKVKTANFDLVTSAKYSLSVLNDFVLDPTKLSAHPSAETLKLLRDVLDRILSLPQVHVSADFIKIQRQLDEMEHQVKKEYKDADKKIQQMTIHVQHINRQLERLHEYVSQPRFVREDTDVDERPTKKRKRRKSSRSHRENEIPHPVGFKQPSHDNPTRSSILNRRPTSDWLTKSDQSLSFDDDEYVVRQSHALQPSTSRQSSMVSSWHSVRSSSTQQHGFFTPAPLTPVSSVCKVPSSNVLSSRTISTLKVPSMENRKRRGREASSSHSGVRAKRKRSKSPDQTSTDASEQKSQPREIILLKGSGGGGGSTTRFCGKLQAFLKKQPQNTGASFNTTKEDGRYHCTVSFWSNFAITSRIQSSTPEEAEGRAALEANRWIRGSTYKTNDLASAKTWFDAYSMQVTGNLPGYISFKANPNLYFACVHLVNNNLFLFPDSLNSHKLFLEATCKTTRSKHEIDVEDMTIKSALQGNGETEDNEKPNIRQALNDYCLRNGGTIPITRTTEARHPNNGKIFRSCTLKSFSRNYLCQTIPRSYDCETVRVTTESDGFHCIAAFADFLEAYSLQPQQNQILAEESAAGSLLEKLGIPLKISDGINESYKHEVESYAYEMNLSAAYHTVEIASESGRQTYHCVVTSKCLHGTNEIFSVSSDGGGFLTEEEAVEMAAKNALILLGQPID